MNKPEKFSKKSYKKSYKKDKSSVESKSSYNLNGPPEINVWRLYFPNAENKEDEINTNIKISSFESYIHRNGEFVLDVIEENRCFCINLKLLNGDETFRSQWKNFDSDLNENTEYTLSCLGYAMHKTIKANQDKVDLSDDDQQQTDVPIIRARILNYQPIVSLKNIKVNYYGKLVSLHGTVIRVANVKLMCRWMAFNCELCGTIQVLQQTENMFTPPVRCPTTKCKNKSRFNPLLSSPHTRTNGFQIIKLQEQVGNQCEGGRIPRTIECELSDDLVNSCVPGDDITVTGILKVRSEEMSGKQKQAAMFQLYMNVVSLVNSKTGNASIDSATAGIEFSVQDYYAIQKIHAEPCVFQLLVHSLCPSIYGHDMVKAGLLLSLFGGGVCSPDTRSDSHVLMVGDPGLGKSQMLHACTSVAPRGLFVCGNGSTTVGLTAAMIGGALEAGALVLADNGCCCIDELDKMTCQHAALLEVMEQQTISIAKAGVVCSLPARTTIMAAANPIGGHFDMSRTVAENLKMGAALLSRFDLVFLLLDKPDKHIDGLLSEHVLGLHNSSGIWSRTQSFDSHSSCVNSKDQPLQERLKVVQDTLDVLPHQLFRKYIAYARKYVNPKLSAESAQILKDFFIDLRKKHHTKNSVPVTTRQLESLMRLTQARAKLELRELTTAQDAIDVVDILKYSLIDTFSDNFGRLDFQGSQNGSGVSAHNQVKKIMKVLQQRAEFTHKSTFTVEELKDIFQNTGCIDKFHNLLDSLNLKGLLLKKGPSLYKLSTVDF